MNAFRYILSGIIFIAAVITSAAQTYYIPDDNLRAKLISDYASVMAPNGELIIASAKGLSTDLNLDNLNISNADGLQFFESSGILRLRNNNLTSFPQLSFMKGVRRVYVSNNFLTDIPDLSALYQLIDLNVVNNNLTALPTIQTKTTLQSLACSGNKIIALPDLSALTNLNTLIVSFNPITSLPDLTANVNLKTLDVRNTNIHNIPSLPALVNLEVLNCENNAFTDLSGLNANTSLLTLTAQNNGISVLPDFSNKASLSSVNISHNNLTFEDILPLLSLPTAAAFNYAPQNDLSIPLYVALREPNTFSYQISIDGSLGTDQFTWYKNNVPAMTDNTGTFAFNPVFMGDSGTYSVQVSNAAVPGLLLKSNVSDLSVRPCIEINRVNMTVLSSDCRQGSAFDLAATIVDGSIAPLTYLVQATGTGKTVPNTTATQFGFAVPGTYVLQVTDSRNCTATKTFVIDRGADCEHVFSPNGDGIMDSYFIPDSGTAQIFSTSRTLIKTLTLPASWDGTTSEGQLADAGYYVVVINGVNTIGISLFR